MSNPKQKPRVAWDAGPGPVLAPLPRALFLGASTLALLLSGPGIGPFGPWSPLLGALGLGLWALAAGRTGPRRKLMEWSAGAVYGAVLMSWVAYISPPSVAWIGVGWGLYYILAGTLLRRLRHHCGLPLAAALSYTAVESLRALLPTPFGLSWIRMGHLAADFEPLLGAAALFGVGGLGFLLAALGGLLAQCAQAAMGFAPTRDGGLPRRRDTAWVLALSIFCLAYSATHGFGLGLDPEADFEVGPRVLLVQPGIPQERKQELNQGGSGLLDLVNLQTALSLSGVAREAAAGTPVDLVCWGESMLPGVFIHASLADAQSQIDATSELEWPVWDLPSGGGEAFVKRFLEDESFLIGELHAGAFLAARGAPSVELPAAAKASLEGVDLDGARAELRLTSFVAGALQYIYEDNAVRRTNGGIMWNSQVQRTGSGWKRHLVPAAETLGGLETWEWARGAAHMLMGYTPDFRASTGPQFLTLEDTRAAAGTSARDCQVGVTICFDNGYEDVYLGTLEGRQADFNLVLSNEAWYRESQEFDQMMAMSAIWAAASGRSIVRATNSGISAVLGPGGRELGRLLVGGKDRAVAGSAAFNVPIPKDLTDPSRTVYSRTVSLWNALWLLAPLVLLGLAWLLGGRPVGDSGAELGQK